MLATSEAVDVDDNPSNLQLPTMDETEQVASDFLAIDDLLDFSNDDIIGGPIDSSLSSSTTTTTCIYPPEAPASLSNMVSSPKLDKRPPHQLPAASVLDSDELCVPCDDLAELEWLSNFVEESFSSGDHVPANFCLTSAEAEESKTRNMPSMNESFHSTSPVSVLERINAHSSKLSSFGAASDTSVPARTRSKRCRTAVCFWNTRILSADASESILESSSTASTITAASSDSDVLPTYYDGHEDDDDYEEDEHDNEDDDDIDLDSFRQYSPQKRVVYPTYKVKKFSKLTDAMPKPKKRAKAVDDDGAAVRKCLHCGATKTPQWRAGPMGPKTLCNACGVRYKSGRLCAEYRPAASPSFNENVHSNSHRKVLEIRRQRGELSSPIIAHQKLAASRFDRQENVEYVRVKENFT